jgi:CheY-like chemotaxis protein
MNKNGKRVLIIDDDPDFTLAAKVALAGAGYTVAECGRAAAAIDKIHEFKPDLLILDVMMETGSAGFEVSYQVRKDAAFAGIPILMVTAIHSTTKVRFSPETDGEFLPVQQLLDKPVPAEKLIAAVAQLLKSA